MDRTILAVLITVLAVAALVAGTNLYLRSKERDLYAECLRVTERLLDSDPKRISTPYCRL